MKKNTRFILTAGALIAATILVSSCSKNYPPLETVPSVDLNKYTGRWYEIASLPQRFTKGCHCVYAEYTLNPSGYVEVYNYCRKGGTNGEVKDISGKAFPVEGSDNSRLKVQFFWPFKGDYWILELDPEYKHVLVGSPDRESLWILSRTPALDDAVYNLMVQQAKSKGFPVEQLEKMDQSCYK
ncbi:apolipoprotein D and lipocalin family protein [Pontibacter aydingkolensis]|uniref:Lipocalin family protein n=1 Tax=Pontibacter aydingkolensis TaxID=1911536 RepID=A0ABS7CQ50_9BACT|nr:lipocalin family protein [Pontibacter aydingkolensis]MBW7465908.1 lipocalin family protein [Pontibacter aydingkolensis]